MNHAEIVQLSPFADQLAAQESPGVLRRRTQTRTVAMIVRRRIKQGCHELFDTALHRFVSFADSFPGHVDVHILSRLRDGHKDCAIVHRFVDTATRRGFTSSPEYGAWLRRMQLLSTMIPDDKQRTAVWT